MSRRLAWLAAAVLAVAISGCGEDEPELPEESARVLLDRALSDPPESAQAVIDFDLAGEALPVGVAGRLEGPYSPDGSVRFSLDYELEVAGLGAEGTVTSTGEALYVVFFGENYREPLGSGLRPPGGDAVDLSRDATYDGVAEVDGVDTARIESQAKVEAPSPVAPQGGDASVVLPEVEGRVVAWVGIDDGQLRRLQLDAPGITATVELSELGESFAFSAPEGGGFRPLSDLLERFSAFL